MLLKISRFEPFIGLVSFPIIINYKLIHINIMGNTVKMSSTGLSESIKVNKSSENFNKNLFDVVKDKKLNQQALLEIQGETKIIQEVK